MGGKKKGKGKGKKGKGGGGGPAQDPVALIVRRSCAQTLYNILPPLYRCTPDLFQAAALALGLSGSLMKEKKDKKGGKKKKAKYKKSWKKKVKDKKGKKPKGKKPKGKKPIGKKPKGKKPIGKKPKGKKPIGRKPTGRKPVASLWAVDPLASLARPVVERLPAKADAGKFQLNSVI